MRNRLICALIAALAAALPAAAAPTLRYVVIITRHGVRSPTWGAARLNQYSAQPWPDWGVAPGELTPHGRDLVGIIGAWHREWLTREGLYPAAGCADAGRLYILTDNDHRTVETGRLLAESLLPGCGVSVHHQAEHRENPIFKGAGNIAPELAAHAVRERLGPQPDKIIADHASAFTALRFILTGGSGPAPKLMQSPTDVEMKAGSVALTGPLATGSTLSEDLLLEYADGMSGADLGWGRLTKEKLFSVLELHSVYADLIRRTPLLARARGSNLLAHLLCSMEQAVCRRPVTGALGSAGDVLLVLSGHDTNIANLSGMLGLSWRLPGYWPNDTPPGGALVFSLWRKPNTGGYFVRAEYVAQTLDQMRNGERLSAAFPPAFQEIPIPGCESAGPSGCSWRSFRRLLQRAIDPAFTTIGPELQRIALR